MTMGKALFDRLADNYDQDILDSDNLNLFPFAGYQKIMDFIAADIEIQSHLGLCRILDLGIGTGNLESKIKPNRIELTGVDFSEKMLEVAQLKLHDARLFCADFLQGLPEEIQNEKFDIIVSTYAMHHLEFPAWVDYLTYLSQHLTVFGKIYIGDILFLNETEKRICHDQNAETWDSDEHYHVYEEIATHICEHLAVSFVKVSYCAGIIILENYHECSLHADERKISIHR
jgi:putative AdoMet-dependent methyltransferase